MTASTRPAYGGGRIAGLRIVFGVRTASAAADAALVAARTALAWIFVYYGAGKLFGAFNGQGIHGTAAYFSHAAGLHPGTFWAVLGGVIEFGGGIAMALGFATRPAGLALFGDMVVATITITGGTGLDSSPGYQVNLAVGALALVMVFLGSGRASLDALIDRALVRRGG